MNDGTTSPSAPARMGETTQAVITLLILFQLFGVALSIAGYRPSPLVSRLQGMFAWYLRPLAMDVDGESGFHLTRESLLDGTPQLDVSWTDDDGESREVTISGASGPGVQGRLRRGRLAATAVVNTLDETTQSFVPLAVAESIAARNDASRMEVSVKLRTPAPIESATSPDEGFRDPNSNYYLEELYAAVAQKFDGKWSATKLEPSDEAAPPTEQP